MLSLAKVSTISHRYLVSFSKWERTDLLPNELDLDDATSRIIFAIGKLLSDAQDVALFEIIFKKTKLRIVTFNLRSPHGCLKDLLSRCLWVQTFHLNQTSSNSFSHENSQNPIEDAYPSSNTKSSSLLIKPAVWHSDLFNSVAADRGIQHHQLGNCSSNLIFIFVSC